jgi:molecular chaperone GrpE (heat shock protein)
LLLLLVGAATCLAVLQSGYKIHDRILRAAKVIVYQE